MTAGPAENAAAASAQAGGETESQAWMDHAEQLQSSIAGSQIDASDAGRGPEAAAVTWPSG